MNNNNDMDRRRGLLCGLLASGLRLEGLIRVALERPATADEIAPQISEEFALYSEIFRQAWAAPDAACGSCEVPETAPEAVCAAEAAESLEPAAEEIRDEETCPEETAEGEASEAPEAVEAVVEPVAESVAEPVAELVAEPVAELVVEPVAESVAEPAAESVCEALPEEENVVVVESRCEERVAPRPLADSLKVDELLARKESADLRRAFTLNDKFRFRRTLFGGSDERFGEVLDRLEVLGSYAEAEGYLCGVLDTEPEEYEDFMTIIKAHYQS